VLNSIQILHAFNNLLEFIMRTSTGQEADKYRREFLCPGNTDLELAHADSVAKYINRTTERELAYSEDFKSVSARMLFSAGRRSPSSFLNCSLFSYFSLRLRWRTRVT
jgi:hypothetical protein